MFILYDTNAFYPIFWIDSQSVHRSFLNYVFVILQFSVVYFKGSDILAEIDEFYFEPGVGMSDLLKLIDKVKLLFFLIVLEKQPIQLNFNLFLDYLSLPFESLQLFNFTLSDSSEIFLSIYSNQFLLYFILILCIQPNQDLSFLQESGIGILALWLSVGLSH